MEGGEAVCMKIRRGVPRLSSLAKGIGMHERGENTKWQGKVSYYKIYFVLFLSMCHKLLYCNFIHNGEMSKEGVLLQYLVCYGSFFQLGIMH